MKKIIMDSEEEIIKEKNDDIWKMIKERNNLNSEDYDDVL